MNNFKGYSETWIYQPYFLRILLESLNVAWIICINELPEFTSAKLFDIMNQIIPTGFVLSTGYWPFYSYCIGQGQSLCICSRFRLECRHKRQAYHWIDLNPLPNDNSVHFNLRNEPLQLMPIEVTVVPVPSPQLEFMVTMKLRFSYVGSTTNENNRAQRFMPNERLITISARYASKCQWYPAPNDILFQQNPYLMDFYEFNMDDFFNYGSYYIGAIAMPDFTLVMDRCNVPIYIPPHLNNLEMELEVWKRIYNCEPIWDNHP